jgi:ligand-binding SRPBCC domain-containing protein
MRVYSIQAEQVVPRPLDEVFAFFDRPENLQKLTPPSLGFEILTPEPLEMYRGALIDYTIKIWGVPLHWRTLITCYDPPHKFVDEQLKGPYSFWHHTHTFTEVEGGTKIADHVRYAMPFGILGRAIHAVYVERDLKRIFGFREKLVRELFG